MKMISPIIQALHVPLIGKSRVNRGRGGRVGGGGGDGEKERTYADGIIRRACFVTAVLFIRSIRHRSIVRVKLRARTISARPDKYWPRAAHVETHRLPRRNYGADSVTMRGVTSAITSRGRFIWRAARSPARIPNEFARGKKKSRAGPVNQEPPSCGISAAFPVNYRGGAVFIKRRVIVRRLTRAPW